MRFDNNKRIEIIKKNDRWMTQILRILYVCTGYPLKPTSSKSCINFYHKILKAKVIKRSGKTGNPSLDEKALLKLAIEFDHPTIPLVLEYRRLAKQTGQLKFRPWSFDDSIKLVDRDIRKELEIGDEEYLQLEHKRDQILQIEQPEAVEDLGNEHAESGQGNLRDLCAG